MSHTKHTLRWGTHLALYIALAAGALLLFPATAVADDDDDDDHEFGGALVEELILGESPYTEEAGEFGATFSVEYLEEDDENLTDLILELEYGITDTLQVGVELPYGFIDGKDGEPDEDGMRDISVSLTWNFLNQDGLVLSVMGEGSFKNGDEDKDLGEEDAEYEAMLLAAYRIGEVELYGGAGAEWTDNDEAFEYSAGIAFPLGPVVGLVEVAGTEGADLEEDEATIAPGFAFELFDDVQATVGVPIGLNNDTADWGVTARIAFEF